MEDYYNIMSLRINEFKENPLPLIGMEFYSNLKIKYGFEKQRILPDQYIVKQGDEGHTPFNSLWCLRSEIDGKKVGKMESGEIFGELSLILMKIEKLV